MRRLWYVLLLPVVAQALGDLGYAVHYRPVEGDGVGSVPQALPPKPDPLPLVEIPGTSRSSALTFADRRAVVTWAELELPSPSIGS